MYGDWHFASIDVFWLIVKLKAKLLTYSLSNSPIIPKMKLFLMHSIDFKSSTIYSKWGVTSIFFIKVKFFPKI